MKEWQLVDSAPPSAGEMSAPPESGPRGVNGRADGCETVEVRGLTGRVVPVRVAETGSGVPLVFLHGLVGLNEHWENVVSGLEGSCRCTRLELPLLELEGEDCSVHGASALIGRYLEARRAATGGGPVTLVGNSFGGHCALRLALDRPDLVRALVLAGSGGLLERSYERVPSVSPQRPWLADRVAELFHDKSLVRADEVDRAFELLSERRAARALVKLSRSARKDHLGEHLERIWQPTLLIWGRDDVVTPPAAAQEFLRRMPDARIAWIERCGHAPMLEAPGSFVSAVREFVAALAGGSGTSSGAGSGSWSSREASALA